jgi:hypothetical protein
MREVKNRRTNETTWHDVRWAELTKAQQDDVLHGSACGHPSNRPTLAVAKTWTYVLSADKTRVVSMVVGGFF